MCDADEIDCEADTDIDPREEAGLLGTPRECFDAGYGWGAFRPDSAGAMLALVHREHGPLEAWQYDAMLAGRDVGALHREEHFADLKAGADRPAARGDDSDLPY